jgi:hypothetical protein
MPAHGGARFCSAGKYGRALEPIEKEPEIEFFVTHNVTIAKSRASSAGLDKAGATSARGGWVAAFRKWIAVADEFRRSILIGR